MSKPELRIPVIDFGIAPECATCFFGKSGEQLVIEAGLEAGMRAQQAYLTVRPLILFGDMWDAGQLIESLDHEVKEFEEAMRRRDLVNAQEETVDILVFGITALMFHANKQIRFHADGTRSGLKPQEQIRILKLMSEASGYLSDQRIEPNQAITAVIKGKNERHWPASRLQMPEPRPVEDELFQIFKRTVKALREERRVNPDRFIAGARILPPPNGTFSTYS